MKPFIPLIFCATIYAASFFPDKIQSFWKAQYYYSDPLHDELLRNEITLKLMQTYGRKIFVIGSSSVSEGLNFKDLNKTDGLYFYRIGIPLCDPLTILEWRDKLIEKNPETIIYMINPLHSNQRKKTKMQEWVSYYQYKTSFYNIEKKLILDKLGIEKWKGQQEYSYYSKRTPMENISYQAKNWWGHRTHLQEEKKLFMDFTMPILAHGVRLIVIERPNYSLIDKSLKETGRDEMNRFLKFQAKRFGFKFLPAEKLPHFIDQDFNDFTHLSETGRNKLTDFIKEQDEFID